MKVPEKKNYGRNNHENYGGVVSVASDAGSLDGKEIGAWHERNRTVERPKSSR